jgi:hypothetical protein
LAQIHQAFAAMPLIRLQDLLLFLPRFFAGTHAESSKSKLFQPVTDTEEHFQFVSVLMPSLVDARIPYAPPLFLHSNPITIEL